MYVECVLVVLTQSSVQHQVAFGEKAGEEELVWEGPIDSTSYSAVNLQTDTFYSFKVFTQCSRLAPQ